MPPNNTAPSDLLKIDINTLRAGKVVDAINDAIERVVRDINNRPNLTKAREVTLSLQFIPPDKTQDGVRTTEIGHRVAVKLPDEPMERTVALLKGDGAYVSPLGTNDVQQNLLPFVAGSTPAAP